MGFNRWCAAVFAAFLLPAAVAAQDVTLTARDGSITLDGALTSFDGEFYRIETRYGLLTVDGEGVICTGPGCPELTAPRALLRIAGAQDAGFGLLPSLLRAFAESRGLVIRIERGDGEFAAQITDPKTGQVLADITFSPSTANEAREALATGQAELIVAAVPEPGQSEKVLALDALIPIVGRDNQLPLISTSDLAQALAGDLSNWRDLGGPDMPLILHALEDGASLQEALVARLGRPVAAAVTHPTLAALAEAVARDPWGLAVTGLSAVGAARTLPLTDSCGFPLLASALAVKSEDYPLSLPLYLVPPPRRLPLVAREFLEFLSSPPAQAAIARNGYVDRAPSRMSLTSDGFRLVNAIRGAGDEIGLGDLKRLADAMAGTDRLSLTFRFQDGSSTLDAHSRQNLTDLVQRLEIGQFRGEQIVFAGFSDGSGDAVANLALSLARAESVAAELAALAIALPEDMPPAQVIAFGEALPMACDTTVAGRQVNRRVELWLRPAPLPAETLAAPPTDSLVP